jgi:hypothetical protein
MKQVFNWENVMPEEPETFQHRIYKVLDSLPEEQKEFHISRKKYVPIFVLVIFLLSSITALAALKWNDRAVDNFGADEKMQKSLSDKGYSKQDVQSVNNNGITVTLKQTIQDENFIYMLFNVSSKNKKITEDNAMSYSMEATNGSDFYSSISASFVDKLKDPSISNDREYEIWIQKNAEYNFNHAKLNCNFNALQEYEGKAGPERDLVKGQWNFIIDLSSNTSSTFEMKKAVLIDGCNITIQKIKISPLSYTIYCDGKDVKELQKVKNIKFDELETTYPLIISAIQYKDKISVQEEVALMSEGFDQKNGEYVATGKFSKAIDMNQIQSVLFGDKKTSVSIK